MIRKSYIFLEMIYDPISNQKAEAIFDRVTANQKPW
jgi:hypothetical protein